MTKYDTRSQSKFSFVLNTRNSKTVNTPTGSGVYFKNGRSFSPLLKVWRSINEPTIGSLIPSHTFITISNTDTVIAGNRAISVIKYVKKEPPISE